MLCMVDLFCEQAKDRGNWRSCWLVARSVGTVQYITVQRISGICFSRLSLMYRWYFCVRRDFMEEMNDREKGDRS